MKEKYLECFKPLNENIFENILENNGLNRLLNDFSFLPIEEKIKQYSYTSLNNKFGNCLEELTHTLLVEYGATFMEKRQEQLDFDNLFIFNNYVVLIEQKVRDDHDSTKKEGQVLNYNKKKDFIQKKYPEYQLFSCMWFMDPSFTKNQNYYKKNIPNNELLYGDKIDIFLTNIFNKKISLYEDLKTEINNFHNKYQMNMKSVNFNKFTVTKLYPLFIKFSLDSDIIKLFFGEITEDEFISYLKKQRRSVKREELLKLYDRK